MGLGCGCVGLVVSLCFLGFVVFSNRWQGGFVVLRFDVVGVSLRFGLVVLWDFGFAWDSFFLRVGII